jgi:hypothetical protein
MQEKEVGDGTNFVIIFGSQLLQNAGDLLQMVSLFFFEYRNASYLVPGTKSVFFNFLCLVLLAQYVNKF